MRGGIYLIRFDFENFYQTCIEKLKKQKIKSVKSYAELCNILGAYCYKNGEAKKN